MWLAGSGLGLADTAPEAWTGLVGKRMAAQPAFAFDKTVKAVPPRPAVPIDAGGSDRLIYYLDQSLHHGGLPDGIKLTEAFINRELEGTFKYINSRYDCSDFRMNSLVRLYLAYRDHLPQSTQSKIKRVMLDFKYWMDQGGSDSMCYWTENHQILFATQEFLVGQTFPDDIFTVDGKTGREHAAMAKTRINAWIKQRFLYGFSEWYSNNYYPEDVAPMANFIQFSKDQTMVNRMKMIMDLIWFDMASQSFKYSGTDPGGKPRTYYIFVSSSGRMYSDNRVSDDMGNRMRDFIDFIIQPEATRQFSSSWSNSRDGFFNCFRQMIEARNGKQERYYEVPGVIKAIFDDPAEAKIIASSQSLDVEELKGEGLLGQADNQIMMQWNMHAFTNPPAIQNTMRTIEKNHMFTNADLHDFNLINLWPLKRFGLMGEVSKKLTPYSNGVALERANVYTYKTAHYSMHTAQAYQPGEFANQQAISSLNLTNYLSIFATHPARTPPRTGPPSYWVGNGRQPCSVQEKNVNLQIYLPPTAAGFREPMDIFGTTHVFFPVGLFDEVDESHRDQGHLFGRAKDVYVMIKGRHALRFVDFAVSAAQGSQDAMLARGRVAKVLKDRYDLVQTGPGYHYFVIEASSSARESFAAFKARTMANPLEFNSDCGNLQYETILNQASEATKLQATYQGEFHLNGKLQNLDYPRYKNAYVVNGSSARKAGTIHFAFAGKTLSIDHEKNLRAVGD